MSTNSENYAAPYCWKPRPINLLERPVLNGSAEHLLCNQPPALTLFRRPRPPPGYWSRSTVYEVLDVAIYDLTWVMHEIVSGELCTREESGIDLHLVAMQLQTIPYPDRLGFERKGSCMIKSEAANQSLFPPEIGQLCCRDFQLRPPKTKFVGQDSQGLTNSQSSCCLP